MLRHARSNLCRARAPRAAIERVVDSGRAAVFPSAFVRGLRWMVEELASGASASMAPAVAR